MLKTVNNVAIRNSVIALGRGYAQTPDFNTARASEIAHKIDALCAEEQTMHVVVALTILLLKELGTPDAFDTSRLARS